MTASVLGTISLGYQWLWNRQAQPAAVKLFVDSEDAHKVDTPHLLHVLREIWGQKSPALLLSVQSPQLLLDLQEHGAATAPRLLEPGQIYADVAQPELIEQGLNPQDVWTIAGWPVKEVWPNSGQPVAQAGVGTIQKLLTAIDVDASLELIEQLLVEEPILAYRFLCHINSTPAGQRGEIDNIRRGLMVLGMSALKAWLLAQRALASQGLRLQPMRIALITRAHLMERLLDAGDEDDLRREVYWCGLLSQMDRLLNEPMATVLRRLPLTQRIEAALLEQTGPYRPYLDIAASLESDQTRETQELCQAQELSMEEVNRSLLKTLAALDSRPAA